MKLIHKGLVSDKCFWGFVKMQGSGWRFGFGRGFFEWSTKSCSGIWLKNPDW